MNNVSYGEDELVITNSIVLGTSPNTVTPPALLLIAANHPITVSLPPVRTTVIKPGFEAVGVGGGFRIIILNITGFGVTLIPFGTDTISGSFSVSAAGDCLELQACVSLGTWQPINATSSAAGVTTYPLSVITALSYTSTVIDRTIIISNTVTGPVSITMTASPVNGLVQQITNESGFPVTIIGGSALLAGSSSPLVLSPAAPNAPTRSTLQFDSVTGWHII